MQCLPQNPTLDDVNFKKIAQDITNINYKIENV